MDKRDNYQILGIARNSTAEEIKSAYHDIARVLHPDSKFYHEIIEYTPNADQVDLFKAVTQAYNTLINPQKRAEYDRTLPPEAPGTESYSSWNRSTGDTDQQQGYKRTQKSSAAYGTFGVTPKNEDNQSENTYQKYSNSQPQFNKTAFGHSKEHEKISGIYKVDRDQSITQAQEKRKRLFIIAGGIGAFALGMALVLVGIASKF